MGTCGWGGCVDVQVCVRAYVYVSVRACAHLKCCSSSTIHHPSLSEPGSPTEAWDSQAELTGQRAPGVHPSPRPIILLCHSMAALLRETVVGLGPLHRALSTSPTELSIFEGHLTM